MFRVLDLEARESHTLVHNLRAALTACPSLPESPEVQSLASQPPLLCCMVVPAERANGVPLEYGWECHQTQSRCRLPLCQRDRQGDSVGSDLISRRTFLYRVGGLARSRQFRNQTALCLRA